MKATAVSEHFTVVSWTDQVTYLIVNVVTKEIVTANRDESFAHKLGARISEFNGGCFGVQEVTLH